MSYNIIGVKSYVWRKMLYVNRCRFLMPIPEQALTRSTHNNLYQMVKKRTLEARTKSQANNKFSSDDSRVMQKGHHATSSKIPNVASAMMHSQSDKSKSKGCDNTELLRATPFACEKGGGSAGAAGGAGGPRTTNAGTYNTSNNASTLNSLNTPSTKPAKGSNKKSYYPEEEDRCDYRGRQDDFTLRSSSASDGKCPPPQDDVGPCLKKGITPNKNPQVKCPPPPCRPPPPPCPSAFPKMLAALLAGLGLGGLLFWLFSGSKGSGSGGAGSGAGEDDHHKKGAGGVRANLLKSSDLPHHVPYLLIGGGSASFSAFRSIKSNNPTAKILMITNECRKPYMRPPLSKELWYTAQSGGITKDYRFKQWTGSERSLFFEPDEFFVDPRKLNETANGGLAVAEGFTVKKIDAKNQVVTLSDGYQISYDECLIATGCSPKNLHVFQDAPPGVKDRVMVYRTPDDFERLKCYADNQKTITIVGNGFIGSELACSLAKYAGTKGARINQVYQETGNMSKVIPDYLSRWTTKKIEELGVCVIPNARIRKAERDEQKLKLHLNNGNTILTDLVVVCVGCVPNTSLAKTSCLEVDKSLGGFLVNAELEARSHLFVAGDASCFYDPLLGRRRVEHHDHSVVSGRLAGENMVGMKKPYVHQSMFWSDLGPDIGYEGIGLVDSSLPTVGVFALASSPSRAGGDNLDETKVVASADAAAAAAAAAVDPHCKEPRKDGEHGKHGEPGKHGEHGEHGEPITCPSHEDYGRGVIFYLKNDKVVGILLWNLFNRVGLARTIINQNTKYEDLNEVAKLFEIHS